MKCHLCGNDTDLCLSHIIPQFISNWMKKNSTTGKLRTPTSPNMRVQDTQKLELLCFDCEQLFSQFEKYFNENIFIPVMTSFSPQINYDENLLKFIISLHWRILKVDFDSTSWESNKTRDDACMTLENWKQYLLYGKELLQSDSHMLLLRIDKDAPLIPNTTMDLNYYFFETIDATITQNKIGDASVYVKIPGFAFISNLTHHDLRFFISSTKINSSGSIDFRDQKITNHLYDFFCNRHVQALSPFVNMSSIQKNVITKNYAKNIDKFEQSFFYKILNQKLK